MLTQNLDRNVVQPHWSADGKSIFVLLEDDSVQTLLCVPVSGGAPEPVVGGRRSITAYDVSKNGKVIVRSSTPDRPYEIFAAEKNAHRDNGKRFVVRSDEMLSAFLELERITHELALSALLGDDSH